MHPVVGKCFSCDGFCLSYFILMVGKDEIYSTHVYIDLFSVSPEVTGATLYMPTWSAFECFCSFFCFKMSFPKVLAIVGIVTFPERKIADTFFFIFVLFDASACFHAFCI